MNRIHEHPATSAQNAHYSTARHTALAIGKRTLQQN